MPAALLLAFLPIFPVQVPAAQPLMPASGPVRIIREEGLGAGQFRPNTMPCT